jgi:methylmalonyl-CoA carboxyltransferase 5S subunit
VDTEIFDSQIPGGMISNMESQLKQQGAGDKMKEVLLEVPRVRKDAGYPPLVTPSSQIVGTQAVFNVMMGRYKVLTGEFADLMLGYYGDAGARATGSGRTGRQAGQEAADHCAAGGPVEAGMAGTARRRWQWKGCNGSDEDVLTYAMFPQVAPKFFPTRAKGPKNLGKDPAAAPAPAPGGGSGGGQRPRPGAHHDHLRRESERPDPQGDRIAGVRTRSGERELTKPKRRSSKYDQPRECKRRSRTN